jgi:DNA-binding MarR family transcriptional regulator
MEPGRNISLLFDLFVLNQRARRLLALALADVALGADEYAVYSLLFEQGPLTATEAARRLGMPLTTLLDYLRAMERLKHLRRNPHPRDGRAQELSLTMAGTASHRRTNKAWEIMRERLERSLTLPVTEIRRALQALDDGVTAALHDMESESVKTG